jgi:nucleoid DNA-binding protein
MIKADLARIVHDTHGGISYGESCEIVDSILKLMKQSLKDSQSVKLTGFGTFKVIERRARKGRNPQTGETIILPKSRYVTFHLSRLVDL